MFVCRVGDHFEGGVKRGCTREFVCGRLQASRLLRVMITSEHSRLQHCNTHTQDSYIHSRWFFQIGIVYIRIFALFVIQRKLSHTPSIRSLGDRTDLRPPPAAPRPRPTPAPV